MTHSLHPPRPVKKRPSRKAKEAVRAAPPQKKPSKTRFALVITAIVLFVAIAAGLFYYFAGVRPYQRIILSVGEGNIKTGYFLKRVAASSNSDAQDTLNNLTSELIIRQVALDFGIPPATEAEIDSFLREQARGTNETITDEEFDTWFKDQLKNTGLTAEEYREIVADSILADGILEIVSANVSSTVPQLHLWVISLDSNDTAVSVKSRIDGGEDFATVAKEVSLDETTKVSGGDLGWLPTELLSTDLSSFVDVLDIEKCSEPFPFVTQSSSTETTTNYLLFMVSEKSSAKEVTDDQLASLKSKTMNDWIEAQKASTEIVFHGLHGSTTLDSETLSWIDYQVQKIIKKRSSTTS
jgi:PPIC-type PPIASE domain